MIFLALIIVLVSGLIAYVGDLVGRKLGRKRLTLFGLRPRYTAIVISVGVGMVIALLTISSVFAISASIREAFFTPIGLLKGQLHQFEKDLNEKKLEIQTTNDTLTRTKDHLAATEANLNDSNHALKLAKDGLVNIKNQLSENQALLKVTVAQFSKVSRQLEEDQKKLKTLETQLVDRGNDLKDRGKQIVGLQGEMASLQQKKDELTQTINKLNENIGALQQIAQPTFTHLSFQIGQEILSGTVATSLNAKGREAWLNSFLHVAEGIVRQRNPNYPKDLSALVFITGLHLDPPKMERVDLDKAISILSERIVKMSATSKEIIVRLSPMNNVAVDNPALIDIDSLNLIYENDLRFGPGQELARISLTVNGNTTQAEIVSRLVDDLLQHSVPDAMRAKDMIFISRRFDAANPERIPDPSISLVPWAAILTAAEQIREHPGKVEVIARTREALKRADPLNLTFDVVPPK
ncbi:MAG TPA: DUF3084 domain-containing protein [Armatimonadota bacterium]|jgi:hypothetical protein